MKRKGFTLIELLAVIVILAVIGLITIPLIGNVIEDSKKKSLEQSVYGIVEAANYFALENAGVHEFQFNKDLQGETETGKKLNYKGQVDAEGNLYIDEEGNISLCFMNEDYYVYKNYNSGIYVGNVADDTCISGYDALTNKYIAMLDDGSGTVSNVYSKSDVDSLVSNLQDKITKNEEDITALTTIVNNSLSSVKYNEEADVLDVYVDGELKGSIYCGFNELDALIPAMTSAITATGEASASTYHSDPYLPYYAFDGNESSTIWHATASKVSGEWLQFKFNTGVRVRKIRLVNRTHSTGVHAIKEFMFQASKDGVEWTTLATLINPSSASGAAYEELIDNNDFYTYYRVYIVSNYGTESVAIGELQMYG